MKTLKQQAFAVAALFVTGVRIDNCVVGGRRTVAGGRPPTGDGASIKGWRL